MIAEQNQILKGMQKKELQILKEFIKVCDILQLRYFLDSGTLLGAIRHEGFIPWDDDIDVSMPRKDYEIFLKEGQKYLGKQYFIQTVETDAEYTNSYAKVRDSETTFIESSVKNLNINHGLYIDIFPYDGYNKNKKLINFINRKIEMLLNIQINKVYYIETKKEQNIKQKILKAISNILYGRYDVKKILQIKRKIHTKYDYEKENTVKCFSYFSTTNIIYDKNIFENSIEKKFEDIYVKVPQNYDLYLKIMYGDYMKLPPVEKRISHHTSHLIDINKSYKEYIELERSESLCKV